MFVSLRRKRNCPTPVNFELPLRGSAMFHCLSFVPFSTTDKISYRQHTEDLEVLERKLSKKIDDKVPAL